MVLATPSRIPSVGAHLLRAVLLVVVLSVGLAAQTPPPAPGAPGWLGFSFVPGDTVVIRQVVPASPAARAGLVPGDTLVRVNGRTATGQVLQALARELRAGDTVAIEVRRRGTTARHRMEAAPRPLVVTQLPSTRGPGLEREALVRAVRTHAERMRRDQGMMDRLLRDAARAREEAMAALRSFALGQRAVAGAEFTELNPGLGAYFGTDEGLLVLRVARGTLAAQTGLRPGDIVVAAAGRPVRSVAALRRVVAEPARGVVALEIIRRGERRTLRLRE